MNNLTTTTVKYLFNIDNDIICNNMICFTESFISAIENIYNNCNGFTILDSDNIKTPQHSLIYNFVLSVTNKYNINLDDYYMIMRSSIKNNNMNFDLCTGFGEYHDIIKSKFSYKMFTYTS